MNRSLSTTRVASTFALLGLASLPTGCSVDGPSSELAATEQPLLGTIDFDSSCDTPPASVIGTSTAAAIAANVKRHVQIADAYARIAANSPAFRGCLEAVMARPTQLGAPGGTWVSGPYLACSGDPSGNIDDVMRAVLSNNGTRVACDYTVGGGYAGVGAIDPSGRELIAVGGLGGLTSPENCSFNPDGAACVVDTTYAFTADTITHEGMHTHGYTHVADSVWNLNNVNVGDRVGIGTPGEHALTLDEFCGVTPAFTPGNNGIAPTAPTATPTPGPHPTYGTGLPYEVGQCIRTVLLWSSVSGHIHDDCGPTFAGLKLVDSVTSGDPSTATTTCIADPYVGAPYASPLPGARAPIPPHSPTCQLAPACPFGGAPLLTCDDNANFVHLERRAVGASAWERAESWSEGYDYRVCAESLYGRACATPSPIVPCTPELPKLRPIPWWQWQPRTFNPAELSPIAKLVNGDALFVLPVPASLASTYPELGKSSGDLAPAFGALGIGTYNPHLGIFNAIGESTGGIPPVSGTAFATTIGADGRVHVLGFGGESKGAPVGNLYDGMLTLSGKVASVAWTSAKAPFARSAASMTASDTGDVAYLFGGVDSKGATGDLWSYEIATNKWALISALAATPRSDASIAVDGKTLVVFGGHDTKGNKLSDLVRVDLQSAASTSFVTSALPRARAAITIKDGNAFVYGDDVLDIIALADGKLLSSTPVGAKATSGSSIVLDAAGVLTLIPGEVPGATAIGGAFVGIPGALKFISE